ncbi:MAG: hypothetical protein IPL83_02440 [Bdellovibrionales bacterium]|nr:hypothetical protein [Bdellovibrionales bacterium]
MRAEVKQLIESLMPNGYDRCRAISRISLEFEMTSEEKSYFDTTFIKTTVGDDKLSGSRKVRVVQETLAERWAGKYLVYRDRVGNATYLKRNAVDNTVAEVSLDELQRQAALVFTGTILDCHPTETKERAMGWVERTEPITELPPSFAWKNHRGLTFNRFDFEVADLPTPLFEDFLSRLETNREAFMAFVWSLFVPSDHGQQYLWIFGEGQDGKGAMIRLLSRLLNDAFVALDAKDRYWLASCVGKRLGAFNDMVDVTFPMRSQFKQVTGQDPVNVEQKYKRSYSTVLDTKFIFTTNKELHITTQTSDLRRCIYVKMTKNPSSPRKGYEDDLWEERAGILHKCKSAYEKMMQEHGAIVVDQDAAKEVGEQAELKFQVMFNQKLKADETSWVSRVALRRHLTDKHGVMLSNQDYSEFKEWMKRTHDVSERKIVDNGQQLKIYQGVALVTETHGVVVEGGPIKRNVK